MNVLIRNYCVVSFRMIHKAPKLHRPAVSGCFLPGVYNRGMLPLPVTHRGACTHAWLGNFDASFFANFR